MSVVKPKIGIITQARMTSSRLPKKVLLHALGRPVLEHHVDRLRASGLAVYVATTTNETDTPIVELCQKLDVPFSRGSELDVLARFYECAQKFGLDVIVRVTSDCPLIDGKLIREGVEKFLATSGRAYVSNCIERTYPRGMDFEVFGMDSLRDAYINATEPFEREHVTPYVRDVSKNTGVQLIHVKRSSDASAYRLTLDEADDWRLLSRLIDNESALAKDAEGLIAFLNVNPQIAHINAHVEQKKI